MTVNNLSINVMYDGYALNLTFSDKTDKTVIFKTKKDLLEYITKLGELT